MAYQRTVNYQLYCYGSTVLCNPGDGQSQSLKNFSDQVLGEVHLLEPSQVCLDESINQDALIRGVLDGWATLQSRHFYCPLWGVLCQLDTAIFLQSGVLTRLCMLRMIHLLLQVCTVLFLGDILHSMKT